MDGQACYASIDDGNNIGLKITSKKVFDRKKLQGSDSVLGAGFDCSSRCSWRKPRGIIIICVYCVIICDHD